MRKALLLFTFFLKGFLIFGQDYANDWINYSQTYYKIPVVKKGVYRIDYSDLESANFPVDVVDPRTIQLFHRGQELSVEIAGQGDAVFDVADYIQFYGQGNDGVLDAGLYHDPSNQPHQYYNIYSDTTAYFLTWTLDATNGKRIDNFFENNVTNIPVEGYHFGEVLMVSTDEYATGYSLANYIQRTTYDQGEGWSGMQIQENEQVDYSLPGITGSTTSGIKPTIEIQLMGRDDKSHNVEILIGPDVGNLRVIAAALFVNYATFTVNEEIDWTDISTEGELTVRARALGVSGLNDLISVNYIKVIFPQSFDMENNSSKVFEVKGNANDKSYIEIQNKPSNVELWDVTDSKSPLKIGYNSIGSDLNAIVPNTSVSRNILATNTQLSPTSISQHNFKNFSPDNIDYTIISHQAMMQPAEAYSDVVQAYADYRASEAGGGYLTHIFDIEDVYNQFNYGERSPLAIRELMRYLVNEGDPQYLFIIGKGFLINTSYKSNGELIYYRNAPSDFTRQDLIPPAGVPGSDMTYTVGLKGIEGEVAVPTGRISATSPQQVADYLDKVIAHESQPIDDLWRKRILHLSGGKTTDEQSRFKGYVDEFKNIAETHYLGGKVTSLKKQTSAVDEFINVTEEINKGLGLITFYGHSAPNVTDIDIGFVSNPVLEYSNKDKYPLILVNGCNAGQIYNNGYLWGEDWVFTPEKGAIGFIANSYFAYESVLRFYSTKLYEKAFEDESLIGQSIGNIQQAAIQEYLSDNGVNITSETITQQMILQGDPAVQVFGADKPDYSTDNNSLSFQELNGQPVDALADSFAIAVVSKNFGRTELQDLNVRVKRRLEDNSIINYDTLFSPVLHQDTLLITIKNDIPSISGRNIFEVELDYVKVSDELNENNNIAVIEKVLLSNGTKNLLPFDFTIINQVGIELIVQSANLQSELESREYTFELDTVSTFSSPYRKTQMANGKAIAKWSLEILPDDSLTYYWRTKFTSPKSGENDDWRNSSFTYVSNGENGWMQGHRQQYDKNGFIGLNHNDLTDLFSFENVTSEVSVTTYGANHPTLDYTSVELAINNQQFIYSTRLCRDNAINVVAFNKLTTTPYAPIPSSFNTAQTCGRTDQIVNNFTYNDIAGPNDYLKSAIDAVEDGDIVLIFTTGDVQFPNWDASLLSQVERIGGNASTISSLESSAPYILLGRKGDVSGTATEMTSLFSPADEQIISINETIIGVAAQGQMISTIIGPSNGWKSFFDQVTSIENDFSFDVIGIGFDGNEIALFNTSDIQSSLEAISSDNYPFLRLSYQLDDAVNLTTPQLQHWGVIYDAVPEGILTTNGSQEALSVEEGETVSLDFQFINISPISYQNDLEVAYTLLNRSTGVAEIMRFDIASPAPNDTTFFSVDINTIGKVGISDFSIGVNQRIELEQYYENNQIQLIEYLEVRQDNTPPTIDVTFDEAHITNGAVVSSNPLIDITLYDDNENIFITDTTSVAVFLKRNCQGCDYERITFDSDSVVWTPASSDQNFRVLYSPKNLVDSVYYLRVIASDASGNNTGNNPYEITFTTDQVSSVQYYYAHPNPSIDRINFEFELRGSLAPDVCHIFIYDKMGGLVWEITDTDLRIGLNVINFDWHDNHRNLSSGMYIYQIQIIKDGQELPILGSVKARGKLFLSR